MFSLPSVKVTVDYKTLLFIIRINVDNFSIELGSNKFYKSGTLRIVLIVQKRYINDKLLNLTSKGLLFLIPTLSKKEINNFYFIEKNTFTLVSLF